MSLSLGAAGDAQLAGGEFASAYLVDLMFADGPLYLCTLPTTVRDAPSGISYTGLGYQLRVELVRTSEDGAADAVKLSVPIVNEALLALTLGNASNYRGKEVVIWFQVYTPGFVAAGVRQREFRGYMQPVRVTRQRGDDGIVGRIELACSRAGLARARRTVGLRVTDAQQQARYPGDLGCQYVQNLVENPDQWLSKRFQELQG